MISLWIASALTCSNEMHVAVYLVTSFSTGLENGENDLRCQSQALMSTPDVSSCHLEPDENDSEGSWRYRESESNRWRQVGQIAQCSIMLETVSPDEIT